MQYLLDTHAFIWWDACNPALSSTAASAIADTGNIVFVSAATVWEIAIKQRAGRLIFIGSPTKSIIRNGFTPLDITTDHAEIAAALPPIHHDPFDRMLIAQAMQIKLVLITADAHIKNYAVPQLSAR